MEKLCAQLWWQLRHVTQCLHVNIFLSQTLGNDNVNSTQNMCVTVLTVMINNGNMRSSSNSDIGNNNNSCIDIFDVVML